jgi:hypothetical protein
METRSQSQASAVLSRWKRAWLSNARKAKHLESVRVLWGREKISCLAQKSNPTSVVQAVTSSLYWLGYTDSRDTEGHRCYLLAGDCLEPNDEEHKQLMNKEEVQRKQIKVSRK